MAAIEIKYPWHADQFVCEERRQPQSIGSKNIKQETSELGIGRKKGDHIKYNCIIPFQCFPLKCFPFQCFPPCVHVNIQCVWFLFSSILLPIQHFFSYTYLFTHHGRILVRSRSCAIWAVGPR